VNGGARWHVDRFGDVRDWDGRPVAWVSHERPHRRAEAQLIAASPSMRAALVAALDTLRTHNMTGTRAYGLAVAALELSEVRQDGQ